MQQLPNQYLQAYSGVWLTADHKSALNQGIYSPSYCLSRRLRLCITYNIAFVMIFKENYLTIGKKKSVVRFLVRQSRSWMILLSTKNYYCAFF